MAKTKTEMVARAHRQLGLLSVDEVPTADMDAFGGDSLKGVVDELAYVQCIPIGFDEDDVPVLAERLALEPVTALATVVLVLVNVRHRNRHVVVTDERVVTHHDVLRLVDVDRPRTIALLGRETARIRLEHAVLDQHAIGTGAHQDAVAVPVVEQHTAPGDIARVFRDEKQIVEVSDLAAAQSIGSSIAAVPENTQPRASYGRCE